MLLVTIRTFILYIVVLFSIRLMGKSELSKLSPFQLVIVFMIAELAAIPIDSTSASLVNGVIAIFTLMFLQVLISFLSIKSEAFKNFVSGKPSVLVEKGKLNVKELKRLRITVTDLVEQLRLKDCPSLSDVQYAVMESNGQLSVIPKAKNKPLTPQDMQLKVSDDILPMVIVSDGHLYEKNLYAAGLTEDLFRHKLLAAKISDYSEIFLSFYDSKKQIHVYLVSDKSLPYAMEVKL